MGGLFTARRGALASVGVVNPITDLGIAWHSAFWAEDPDWAAPADGGAVASWRNGGDGDFGDATQATAGKQPIFRESVAVLNGKAAIDFDGVDDGLQTGSGVGVTDPATLVVVANVPTPDSVFRYLTDSLSTGGADRHIIGLKNNNNWRFYVDADLSPTTAAAAGSYLFVAECLSGTGDTVEANGTVVVGSGDAGTLNTTGLTLGQNAHLNNGQPFGGHEAFVGLYDGTLTAEQKADLEAWASDHYGLTIA